MVDEVTESLEEGDGVEVELTLAAFSERAGRGEPTIPVTFGVENSGTNPIAHRMTIKTIISPAAMASPDPLF